MIQELRIGRRRNVRLDEITLIALAGEVGERFLGFSAVSLHHGLVHTALCCGRGNSRMLMDCLFPVCSILHQGGCKLPVDLPIEVPNGKGVVLMSLVHPFTATAGNCRRFVNLYSCLVTSNQRKLFLDACWYRQRLPYSSQRDVLTASERAKGEIQLHETSNSS